MSLPSHMLGDRVKIRFTVFFVLFFRSVEEPTRIKPSSRSALPMNSYIPMYRYVCTYRYILYEVLLHTVATLL